MYKKTFFYSLRVEHCNTASWGRINITVIICMLCKYSHRCIPQNWSACGDRQLL